MVPGSLIAVIFLVHLHSNPSMLPPGSMRRQARIAQASEVGCRHCQDGKISLGASSSLCLRLPRLVSAFGQLSSSSLSWCNNPTMTEHWVGRNFFFTFFFATVYSGGCFHSSMCGLDCGTQCWYASFFSILVVLLGASTPAYLGWHTHVLGSGASAYHFGTSRADNHYEHRTRRGVLPPFATDPSFHPRTFSPSSWTTTTFALRGLGATRCSAASAAQGATKSLVCKVFCASSSTSPAWPVGRVSFPTRTGHGQAFLRLVVSLPELRALRSLFENGLRGYSERYDPWRSLYEHAVCHFVPRSLRSFALAFAQ